MPNENYQQPENKSLLKDPRLLRRLYEGLDADVIIGEDEQLMHIKKLTRYEQTVPDSLQEGEPDPDEVLRDLGLPDSTDPRSCIRKKTR